MQTSPRFDAALCAGNPARNPFNDQETPRPMTTTNFETIECCECGILFQIPESYDENRREDGGEFFCPNGHGQSYTNTPSEKIKKLESEKTSLQVEIRQLKCKILGQQSLGEKIKNWFQ
jgi:hypothetical protein